MALRPVLSPFSRGFAACPGPTSGFWHTGQHMHYVETGHFKSGLTPRAGPLPRVGGRRLAGPLPKVGGRPRAGPLPRVGGRPRAGPLPMVGAGLGPALFRRSGQASGRPSSEGPGRPRAGPLQRVGGLRRARSCLLCPGRRQAAEVSAGRPGLPPGCRAPARRPGRQAGPGHGRQAGCTGTALRSGYAGPTGGWRTPRTRRRGWWHPRTSQG
jgi:hypothetical protein